MSKKRKAKTELNLDRSQTSAFLRTLADSIDSGSTWLEGYDVDLSDYYKLKLSLKPLPESWQVKLKVSKTEAQEEEEAGQAEKYKQLKKRMEKYFKELEENLEQEEMASREIVSVFLRDAESMVAHPGKGEAFYDEFRQACSAFQEAFDGEDLSRLKERLGQLAALRDRCHERHK
jgi:XXXCH domain-containing protein